MIQHEYSQLEDKVKYVELRDSESEDAVLYAVREELDMTEAGDFELF